MAERKSTAINPLADEDPRNTIDRCRAVLEWMHLNTDKAGEKGDYGRALVLQTIDAALRDAGERMDPETKPSLEVVRG